MTPFNPPFRIAASGCRRSDAHVKIGFVLNDYYPFGGLQEDCLATALAVTERGHEAHIFTRTWKGDQPEAIHTHLLGTVEQLIHALLPRAGSCLIRRHEDFLQPIPVRETVCESVCVPPPTLSPTDPVPRGLLTLCPRAY